MNKRDEPHQVDKPPGKKPLKTVAPMFGKKQVDQKMDKQGNVGNEIGPEAMLCKALHQKDKDKKIDWQVKSGKDSITQLIIQPL